MSACMERYQKEDRCNGCTSVSRPDWPQALSQSINIPFAEAETLVSARVVMVVPSRAAVSVKVDIMQHFVRISLVSWMRKQTVQSTNRYGCLMGW